MANVLMYPRAAPPGKIRAWVGLLDQTGHPQVRWLLNGQTQSQARVQLKRLRDDDLHLTPPTRQTWVGAVEFDVPTTASVHRVGVEVVGSSLRESIEVRSLPASVPEDGLHILLSSCFYRHEAGAGNLQAALAKVVASCPPRQGGSRPDLALLMGDQVYLDMPLFADKPTTLGPLAESFERKYLENWGGGDGRSLVSLLGTAPWVALPDDHEYWNNYPEFATLIPLTWTAAGRKRYARAARAMYEGFQAPFPESVNNPLQIDVSPMSLLALDTRTHRSQTHLLNPAGYNHLLRWVGQLRRGQVGVLVTGQSLFSPRKGRVAGTLGDWEAPNYHDYKRIVTTLAHAPCPLICITGDVHWGRVIKAASQQPGVRPDIFEIIVSPLSLVTSPGKDSAVAATRHLSGAVSGNVVTAPRHPEPATKVGAFANFLRPAPYAIDVLQTDDTREPATVKGDQIALLSLYRHAGRPRVKVRYWQVDHHPVPHSTVTLL